MRTETELVLRLAEGIDEAIWGESPENLRASEPVIRRLLVGWRIDPSQWLKELSDESLARCIQSEFFRKEAFQECPFRRYDQKLYSHLRKWVADHNTALDLVQGVYTKLLKGAILTFDPESSFWVWLRQVAANGCRDHWRRQRHEVPLFQNDSWTRDDDPLTLAAVGELADKLKAAIQALRPQERSVLEMSRTGFKAADIATQLELPLSKVHRLLFRARRAVEAMLASLEKKA